jgi:hypothetical protein
MLIKLTRPYGQYRSGDIVEMKISAARLLIKQGRAVLASTQERMKILNNDENKMVTNYQNKSQKPNGAE